jgi:hypothetical protein
MRRLLLLAAIAACSHEPNHTPPPAPASAPITQGVPGSQDLAPLQQLGARLSEEKSHRPEAKTSDRLFDALGKQGITLASHHQVLATTAAASYCDLGVTGDAIAIAVCEYDSAAAAAKGKQLMDERYAKLVPDAVRTVHGSTLVTVANARAHADVRDRVIHTFMTL